MRCIGIMIGIIDHVTGMRGGPALLLGFMFSRLYRTDGQHGHGDNRDPEHDDDPEGERC